MICVPALEMKRHCSTSWYIGRIPRPGDRRAGQVGVTETGESGVALTWAHRWAATWLRVWAEPWLTLGVAVSGGVCGYRRSEPGRAGVVIGPRASRSSGNGDDFDRVRGCGDVPRLSLGVQLGADVGAGSEVGQPQPSVNMLAHVVDAQRRRDLV
jgi:hypothetical protein